MHEINPLEWSYEEEYSVLLTQVDLKMEGILARHMHREVYPHGRLEWFRNIKIHRWQDEMYEI